MTTWIGARIQFTVDGRVQGIRQYIAPRSSMSNLLVLMDYTTRRNYLLATKWENSVGFTQRWVNSWIHPNFRITIGHDYAIFALAYSPTFSRSAGALTSPVTNSGITFVSGFEIATLDLQTATLTPNTNANGVDVLFLAD